MNRKRLEAGVIGTLLGLAARLRLADRGGDPRLSRPRKRAASALAICLISALFLPEVARGADFPPPPSGYSWKACRAAQGALLLPRGWFFREETKGDAGACFVSRESTAGGNRYNVGLLLRVLRDLPKKTGLAPSRWASEYLKQSTREHAVVRQSQGPQGPFFAYRLESRSTLSPREKALHTYTLLIANDQTGTLFLVVAEAPESQWREAWRTLEPVLKMLLLDNEI
jgi:hypothetical protein